MSEYLEYGGIEEDAKELRKKVADFFQTDYQVLYDALRETYDQGVADTREQIAREIEKLKDGIEPKNEFIAKHAFVDVYEIVWRATQIAKGKK